MRVLIAEDEPDLLAVLAQSLREDGYAVDTATDGRTAVFKAMGTPYDAIILDLMLPLLDGWGVLKELRSASIATPILILTARDALPDRVRGLDSGADDYLLKPFELDELLARLRAIIRRQAGVTRAHIEIGDTVIDIAVKTVTRNGDLVALTAREYALVEYLALHRDELVSRTMLYDHLFDETEDTLSNLVDVHVHNIRKKLGRDFIVTRRGQGYVLRSGAEGPPGEDADV